MLTNIHINKLLKLVFCDYSISVRLYDRINERVDRMLEAGLLDEVRALAEGQYDPRLPALRTIGYQESLAYLAGQCSKSRMIELIKRNSRRYAKRQLTWFRRYPEYRWSESGI